MSHAAEHFQVRVLPCDTSVSLVVVDDALGVLEDFVEENLGDLLDDDDESEEL